MATGVVYVFELTHCVLVYGEKLKMGNVFCENVEELYVNKSNNEEIFKKLC